jgi:hypothetical protein
MNTHPNIKYDEIILSGFLQLHDRVVKFQDTYGQPIPEKKGTVIGFEPNYYYQEYGGGYKLPGKYASLGDPLVRYDDGSAEYANTHLIAFLDIDSKVRKEQIYKAASIPHLLVFELFTARIGDLPETNVIRGDKVLLIPSIRNKVCRYAIGDPFSGPLYVGMINYSQLGGTCGERTTPYPCYNLSPYKDQSMSRAFNHLDFVLEERGNLWHYYFGNKGDIKFANLEEETSFHKQTGRCTQIRNPKPEGNYDWTLEEALVAIKQGTADEILAPGGLFGVIRPKISVFKFEDGELGARVRAKTLEGFEQTTENTNA